MDFESRLPRALQSTLRFGRAIRVLLAHSTPQSLANDKI